MHQKIAPVLHLPDLFNSREGGFSCEEVHSLINQTNTPIPYVKGFRNRDAQKKEEEEEEEEVSGHALNGALVRWDGPNTIYTFQLPPPCFSLLLISLSRSYLYNSMLSTPSLSTATSLARS